PGITDRLSARRNPVLDEGIHLPCILGVEVRADVEALDRAAESRIEAAGIEVFDRGNTALAGQNVPPAILDGVSHWRDQTQPGHHNPSTSHPRYLQHHKTIWPIPSHDNGHYTRVDAGCASPADLEKPASP